LAVTTEIHPGDTGAGNSLLTSVEVAEGAPAAIGADEPVKEIVGNRGCHTIGAPAVLREVRGVRACVAERRDSIRLGWRDRPAADQDAFLTCPPPPVHSL
jgi:hypothetical protein